MNQKTKNPALQDLQETKHSWIAEDTSLEGTLKFTGVNRIFGELKGKIIGLPGSHLIFMESSRIFGEIDGEDITVNGRVEGSIHATKKITVAQMGRVFGEMRAKDLQVEFGAMVEGEMKISKERVST
jgi:cytoskeletal protein CcmA (bactofilin family)